MRKIMLAFLLLMSTNALTAEDLSVFPSIHRNEVNYQTYCENPEMGYVQQYFTMVAIGTLHEVLKTAPFSEEERKSLESHTALIKHVEENETLLRAIFFDALTSLPGDLSAHVKYLNFKLVLDDKSRSLKEQLLELTNASLLKVLALKDTEIPRDSHMAARITLIITLQAFREHFEFDDERKTEQWNAFLSSFQEQCHSSSTSLINDLLKKMGPSFFQQPLTSLLWNQDLQDDVFDALHQLRKDQFKQAGFALDSNDGILQKLWSYFY